MPKTSIPANAEGMQNFTIGAILKDLAAFAAMVLFVATMAVVLPELSAAMRQPAIALATEE